MTTRNADHVCMPNQSTSGVVHAARDLDRRHVLACNGRSVAAFAWNGTTAEVTCRQCIAGLATGRIVWTRDDRPLAGPCVDCGAPIARAIDYPDHPGHPAWNDDDDHGPGCDGPLNCTCSLPVGAVV